MARNTYFYRKPKRLGQHCYLIFNQINTVKMEGNKIIVNGFQDQTAVPFSSSTFSASFLILPTKIKVFLAEFFMITNSVDNSDKFLIFD